MRALSFITPLLIAFAAPAVVATATGGSEPLNQWVSLQPAGPDNGVGGQVVTGYVGNGGTAIIRTTYNRNLRRLSPDQPWQIYEAVVDGEAGLDIGIFAAVPNQPGVVLGVLRISSAEYCLVRSADDGDTWSRVFCDDFDNRPFRFAVAPSDPLVYYMTTAGQGLLKSIDGGANWAVVNPAPPAELFDFYVDAGDSNTLYGLDLQTIVASRDGGVTFAQSDNGVPSSLFYMDSMAVDPVTPGRLFTGSGATGIVFRSDDGARTWEQFNLPTGINAGPVSSVAIDPLNANRIYASTGFASRANLARSDDAGEQWTVIDSPTGLGIDRFIRFAADGSALLGSTNSAAILEAHTVVPSNAGFNDYTSLWLSATADDDPAFVVLGGFASLIATDPALPNWRARYIDGMVTASGLTIDINNPSIIQTASTGGRVLITDDGGDTWTQLNPPLAAPFVSASTFSPLDNNLKYVSSFEEILVSTDAGQSWTNSSLPPALALTSARHLLASPLDIDVALAGTRDQGAFFTLDMGASWLAADFPSDESEIRDVAFDRNNADRFYVSTPASVWQSDDRGSTWRQVSDANDGLGSIWALVVDPVVPERLYVRTNSGVYARDSRDGIWTRVLAPPPISGNGGTLLFGEMMAGDPRRSGALYHALTDLWRVQLDADADGVGDHIDNCILTGNPQQRDTDGDGIGNLCDADIAPASNDCVVNVLDLGALRAAFLSTPGDANWNADADFTGDGAVNVEDLGVMRQRFFQPLGYSGASACAD